MQESQRRLLADTSHELRKPITIIRGNLALLRREGVPESTRREAVLEGVLAIQEGLNPRLIDQKLRGLLGIDGPSPRTGVSGRAA